MNIRNLRTMIIAIILLVMAPAAVMGQNVDELCRQFITQAFQELGSACANLNDEEACYGYGDLAVTFFADGEPRQELDLLTEAGERTPLLNETATTTVESYEAARFQLDRQTPEDSQWGVGIQLVRGNLPRQLSQNNMVFVQFGGTRVENSVFPDEAVVIPDAPVTVSFSSIALFTSPEGFDYLTQSERIDTLAGGGTLEADAVSPDGAWARVFYRYERPYGERATAWVRVDDLVDATGVDTLPVFGPDDRTAMQDVFLVNDNFGFNGNPCEAVPEPAILVQGPSEIETDFYIDNAPFRITSTAHFRHISPRALRVTSIDGVVQIFPESENEIVLPAGYTAVLCLTPPDDLGIDGQNNDREIDQDCPDNRIEGPICDVPGLLAGIGELPSNVITPVIIPSCINFSTTGGPVTELRYPPGILQRLVRLCESGQLDGVTFIDNNGNEVEVCSLIST